MVENGNVFSVKLIIYNNTATITLKVENGNFFSVKLIIYNNTATY